MAKANEKKDSAEKAPKEATPKKEGKAVKEEVLAVKKPVKAQSLIKELDSMKTLKSPQAKNIVVELLKSLGAK